MIKRAALMLLVLYALVLGATYNGILDSRLRLVGAALVGAVLLLWLVGRRHGHWRWQPSPLDAAILVWIAAFAVSTAANAESWRRIALGLWFMGLYVGVWYLLHDAFANRSLRRGWLVDALLVAGVPAVFVAYAQTAANGISTRPVGTLGNPNSLAALLVMLLPFGLGRLVSARRPISRVLLTFYALAMLAMLGLTFSRGGWLGGIVGLGVWAALSLPLRRWWSRIGLPIRVALAAGAVVAALALGVVLVESLGIGGRGLDLRTFIYRTALDMIAEKPLTGSGLFTFGAALARLNSIPPTEPHSHAHNVILNVAAELGVVGVAALALTAWAAWRALLAARRSDDPIARMGIAAFAGFAAHQMLDLPAMMPTLALVALAALALAMPPTLVEPKPRRWPPAVVALAGLALTVVGLWSALNYAEYVSALSTAVVTEDYRGGAARLQALSQSDPALAIYYEERGMLLGLQAATGDAEAAQEAAHSFAQYVTLEPDYTNGWVNLAVLNQQIGKLNQAADAMREAAARAPQSAPILYRAGQVFEAAGDADSARSAYAAAVALDPDLTLLPEWDDSAARQSAGAGVTLSPMAQTVVLLENGDAAGAQAAWDAFPNRTAAFSNVDTIALMLALAQGDRAGAEASLSAARHDAATLVDRAWQHLGAALLAPASAEAEIAAAQTAITIPPAGTDWDLGANIAYIQYLHLAIPRLFLPQVGYPQADSLLLHLLGDPAALDRLRATIAS